MPIEDLKIDTVMPADKVEALILETRFFPIRHPENHEIHVSPRKSEGFDFFSTNLPKLLNTIIAVPTDVRDLSAGYRLTASGISFLANMMQSSTN